MLLDSKLKEYVQRFTKPQNVDFNYSNFFTQLELSDYLAQLPFFYNLENFCLRLLQAKHENEQICIYSDYDTDAVTATATMYWGLIELGFDKEKLSFYAPDRLKEGYGLNPEAIEMLAQKYDLIITVDCGINSTTEADICKHSRADLIITDHHQLTEEIPDCVSVVNPILGGVYNQNPEKLKPVNQLKLSTLDLLNQEQVTKINQWLTKMSELKDTKNFNLASTSITGVGVAWFSVVWLGYFLAEIEGE